MPAVCQDIPMIELRWLLHYTRFAIFVLKYDGVGIWSQVLPPNVYSLNKVMFAVVVKFRDMQKKKILLYFKGKIQPCLKTYFVLKGSCFNIYRNNFDIYIRSGF